MGWLQKISKKYIIYLLSALIFILIIMGIYKNVPNINKLAECITTNQNSVFLCHTSKNYVSLHKVSPLFLKTLILSEDAGFYKHRGIDYFELWESLKTNLLLMRYKRGASTISQQLVKNVYFNSEKTLIRKFLEILTTYKIEQKYNKDFILEKYLNVVEFGQNVYGIKMATEYFFNKSPTELGLLESIFLVYLLPNPKLYQKVFEKKQHTPFSLKRMTDLLSQLYKLKVINQVEYEIAKNELPTFFDF